MDNFIIELDLDNPEMILDLELFFEVDGDISDVISIDVEQYPVIHKDNYYDFLNERFIRSVFYHIFIELILSYVLIYDAY